MASPIISMTFVGAKFQPIPGANTFRMGLKYAALIPGQPLVAVDLHGDHLGVLTVKAVHEMRLQEALQKFAISNHAVIEAQRFENPREYLRGVLQNAYPDHDLRDASAPCCVVEFQP